MIRFDELSTANITVLNEILASASLPRKDLIRQAYNRRAQHFDSTVGLLEALGCVTVEQGEIKATPPYGCLVGELTASSQTRLKHFLVERLVYAHSSISEPIHTFLALFQGKRELKPSNSNRLRFSGVRNLLIDLEFLQLDLPTRTYIIAPEYLLDERGSGGKCSPRQLKALLAERERIGRAAELAVLDFERRRLAKTPRLGDKIEHVAEKDTGAGFDILSFEVERGANGKHRERFIEVKAVSATEVSFYLTRNEMQTASRLRGRYFLYLVPVAGYLRFDVERLRIIDDPVANVVEDPSNWLATPEVVHFSEARPSSARRFSVAPTGQPGK